MLKKALPEANELALGFGSSDQRMSAGTAKTLVEGLGKSGKIRRGGRIVPLGRGSRNIDFGCGVKRATPIPWGGVASPFYTTGSQYHRLRPNLADDPGGRTADECVSARPALILGAVLARREGREKCKGARCRDTQREPDMGVGRSVRRPRTAA
jgi:hypothetical protein